MKKSVLDDDAYLFTRKEETSDREKLKNMTTRQKLGYLKDYYLIGAIAVAVIAGFAFVMIRDMLRPQIPPLLSVGVINYTMEQEPKAELSDQLQTYLEEHRGGSEGNGAALAETETSGAETSGAETSGAETSGAEASGTDSADKTGTEEKKKASEQYDGVQIDDAFYTDGQGLPKLQVFTMTGQVDLMLCAREDFTSLAAKGFFMDLSELLTPEEMQEMEEYLIFTEGYDESAAQTEKASEDSLPEESSTENAAAAPAPYGVDISGNEMVKDAMPGLPEPVAAVVASAANPETARDAIAYLLADASPAG